MIISYARSKYLLPCIDTVNLTEQTADDALLMTIKEINTAYGKMFGSLFAFPSRLEKIPLMGTTFGAVRMTCSTEKEISKEIQFKQNLRSTL